MLHGEIGPNVGVTTWALLMTCKHAEVEAPRVKRGLPQADPHLQVPPEKKNAANALFLLSEEGGASLAPEQQRHPQQG